MKNNIKESRLEEFASNPKKALWILALPMMVGMSVQAIYQIVDMIFVGRLGSDAIAALAFNLPLLFFAIGIIFGLGSGVTAIIAQFIGMKNKKKADNAAEHSILLGIILSSLFTIIGWSYGKNLLALLGTPEHIMNDAYNYFIILVTGMFFMILSVFFRSILSGEGDTKFPMYVMGSGTIINIILDPILIFWCNLGVSGAAAATIISQAFVCLIFLYAFIIKKYPYITFSPRHFKFDLSIISSILKLGLPASFSMVIMSFGSAIFNKILVTYSADAVSAYQISSRIDHLFFMPVISIVSSMVTLVGMFYGAREIEALKSIVKYGISRSFFITVCSSAFVYFFASAFSALFTQDKEIIEVSVGFLRLMTLVYPFVAIAISCGRVMQGLGKGIPVLVITTVRVLGISAPLALYFSFVLHKSVEWNWYAMMISTSIAFIIAVTWVQVELKKLTSINHPV